MSANGNTPHPPLPHPPPPPPPSPPPPPIAPGIERIDPAGVARELGRDGVDPRLPGFVAGFDAPFFQAGLAGYSDAAMRIIARRHGCPLCVTEALLDRTLLGGGRGFAKADLTELADNVPGGDEDRPLVGQIIGSDPGEMAAGALMMIEQAARRAKAYRELAREHDQEPGAQVTGFSLHKPGAQATGFSWQEPDAQVPRGMVAAGVGGVGGEGGEGVGGGTFAAIDINLACPVRKIRRRARGGHWLAEPEGAIRIVRAVREAVPGEVPVTVKLRRGWDDGVASARAVRQILDAAFEIGVAWVTIHGRTVEQKYVGPSRWDLLRDLVREYPDQLIFGSGDIWEAADIFRMIGYTGVKAVAVARGCIGNPWIFRQARAMLAGDGPRPPTIAEQRAVLEDHFALALAVNRRMRDHEEKTARMMRKFAIRFARHHPRAGEVRRRMIAVSGLEDWRGVLDEQYATE